MGTKQSSMIDEAIPKYAEILGRALLITLMIEVIKRKAEGNTKL